jgi:tRNA-splicing ligase RtcB
MREKLPNTLYSVSLSHGKLEKLKGRDGRVEFATLGRGNHFIEFQADEDGQLWLMIHSGSRAMGKAINEHHLGQASRSNTALLHLEAESEVGRAYLADLDWANRYAEESRKAIAEVVIALVAGQFGFPADRGSVICCNHNHVRKEMHFGEMLWVHRKGAISASKGEYGIIPGSMGTASFHVIGRGNEAALRSSSHGAGRAMSRGQAFKTISGKEFSRQMQDIWFDHRLAEKLRDEAPSAYKDIKAVMRAQRELTCAVRKLRPLLSYKAV